MTANHRTPCSESQLNLSHHIIYMYTISHTHDMFNECTVLDLWCVEGASPQT